jgi:DNA modification methylase
MVLDPPFLTYVKPSKMGIMNGRFSGYWTYEKLLNDYSAAISEAFRILKPSGILVFKCQDTVHNHTLQLTHGRVWLLAEKKGFRLKDLFVLVAPNRLPTRAASHGRQTQRHARVFHCFFLVFEKP